MISQPLRKPRSRAAARSGPLFEPLTPQPAYTRVSTAIEQKILGRTLKPGDALPTETELARQFAVNRSTVREALRRLESAGLVARVAGGKRLHVIRPGQADTASHVSRALALDDVTFIELWEAMLAIAPRTAALAADRRTDAALARLGNAARTAEERRASEIVVAAVVDFFQALAEAGGNRVLVLASEPVTQLLEPSLRRMIDRVPQARDRIVDAQHRILAAVESRDAAEAERWMIRHVRDFRRGYELAGISLETRAA
jgi:DNA-binding FadR family transcriptional regulator